MFFYFLLLLMTLIGAIASLFLKKASNVGSVWEIVRNCNTYVGGMLYGVSALLNIYVLRNLEYSVVLPLTAFTYIWTMLISSIVLKEKVTKKKIVGVTLIVIGAIAISV